MTGEELETSNMQTHNTQDPAVSCQKISFSYPHTDRFAIDKLSLDVRRGEIVAVCGPNGSGKTTLLKLLAGILKPEEGSVFICGRMLDKKGRSEAFRYIGLLFQDPDAQLFCTHVKEDVAYGVRNLGVPEDEVKERVLSALKQTETEHLSERPIHALSYGEMRRVALAGLVAMRPPLLVLDEPTAGLDPASAEHLSALIKRLNREHDYTFLTVTQDMGWAAETAQRMVVMDSGRILADGPIRSVLGEKDVLEKSRLKPPELVELFCALYQRLGKKNREIPLNITEAIQELKTLFH